VFKDFVFKKKSDPHAPVQVAVAPNEVVGSIWKDVLEENGIQCFLKSINLVASMYTAPITMQVEVMVKPEDAEKAREILTPFLENPDLIQDDPQPEGYSEDQP
jgi:hypothetical protein